MIAKLVLWAWQIALDPKARDYVDAALTPVREDDDQLLDLFTKTTGARAALDHLKKVHDLTHRDATIAAEKGRVALSDGALTIGHAVTAIHQPTYPCSTPPVAINLKTPRAFAS